MLAKKQSNLNSMSNTQCRKVRGDGKVVQAPQEGISGVKYWSQILNACKGVTKPRENLLWFYSICINPPNYAFNKWSSPRELLVHSRLAYSRLHNHRLVWEGGHEERESKKESRVVSGWFGGIAGEDEGKTYQTGLFVSNFIFSCTATNSHC